MRGQYKRIKKSKYKYVNLVAMGKGVEKWEAQIPYLCWTKFCDTEKDAGLAVDKKLIEIKKEPVNVLVRRQI